MLEELREQHAPTTPLLPHNHCIYCRYSNNVFGMTAREVNKTFRIFLTVLMEFMGILILH